MVEKCKALIDDYKRRRIVLTVPSIVLAEYLTDFTLDKQKQQQAIIGRHFHIGPFDAKAAAIAAELYSKHLINQVRDDSGVPKRCLKADFKIIATAVAQGAARIYSDDQHFTKFAQGRILVDKVPELKPWKSVV